MLTAPQKDRADRYAANRRITLNFINELGSGSDGCVLKSSRDTAVKVTFDDGRFEKELECYQRIMRKGLKKIAGYNVPQLVDHDKELAIFEMGIVRPPWVLDFGKVALDRKPDYSPEVWQERFVHWEDLFGDDWPDVAAVLSALRQLGIYYMDPKPGNIMPANWSDTDYPSDN